MESTATSNTSIPRSSWIILGSAFLITLLLGFIDEGYYNFNWMMDLGSVMALFIYMIIILACEILFYNVIFGKIHFKGKLFVSICLGAISGIFLAVSMFSMGMGNQY